MFPVCKTWHTWIITGLGLIYQLAGPEYKIANVVYQEKESIECKMKIMRISIHKWITITFVLLISLNLDAQFMSTKEEILLSVGTPDETSIDTNGYESFIYKDSIDNGNGKFERSMVLYFLPYKDMEICTHLRVIYPISELENNIEFFDNNFKKIIEEEWLDPLTGYGYRMDNTYPFCSFLI